MAAKQLSPQQVEAKSNSARARYLNMTPEQRAAYCERGRQYRKENPKQRVLTPEQKAAKLSYNSVFKKSDRAKRQAKLHVLLNPPTLEQKTRKRERQLNWQREHHELVATYSRNRNAAKRTTGKHTAADVGRLWNSQGGICAGCATTLIAKGQGKYHVDHVMPIKLGGSNNPENLQLLCPRCNQAKHTMHPEVWERVRGRIAY